MAMWLAAPAQQGVPTVAGAPPVQQAVPRVSGVAAGYRTFFKNYKKLVFGYCDVQS